VVEGGKVLNTYVGKLSERTAGATTSLSTTVNLWWKLGSQYVAATVEKARETLVEEGRPGMRDQAPPGQPMEGREENPHGQDDSDPFVFI